MVSFCSQLEADFADHFKKWIFTASQKNLSFLPRQQFDRKLFSAIFCISCNRLRCIYIASGYHVFLVWTFKWMRSVSLFSYDISFYFLAILEAVFSITVFMKANVFHCSFVAACLESIESWGNCLECGTMICINPGLILRCKWKWYFL